MIRFDFGKINSFSFRVIGVWGFISSPHFFQADMKFRQDVHGMQPDGDKHEFIMSFDPVFEFQT
jgi:hypothetical protein